MARLPRLRWVILAPIMMTGLLLGLGVSIAHEPLPIGTLLRTGSYLFLATSFVLLAALLGYRLLVDGLVVPAD